MSKLLESISILPYDPKYEDQAVEVLRSSFYPNEMVSIATEISKNPQAEAELSKLCIETARDGVSLVAVDTKSDTVAGIAFNKIQSRATPDSAGQPSYFEYFRDVECESVEAKALMDFMIDVDAKFDMFEHFSADNSIEIMFLVVRNEYQAQGIGPRLVEATLELGTQLKHGLNLDILPEAVRNKRPQFASAIFTSNYSQSVGRKAEFEVLYEEPYTSFEFRGQKYSDKIPSQHKTTKLVGKRLN